MFGYVKVCKPELKIKEFEFYKAVYCSLCKQLGKEYGPLARLTLNYDFTFLALLSMALDDENYTACRKRCTCNPLKKCNYICEKEQLSFPSGAAMIMLYYKLLDNIADEKGFKKLGCLILFAGITIKPLLLLSPRHIMQQLLKRSRAICRLICEMFYL